MPARAERRRTAASRLAASHSAADLAERREALRALLMCPVLPSSGPTAESFRLVRRHALWLSEWLQRWPGWTLVMQSDLARLRKTPSLRPDTTRGVIDKGKGNERTQFSRRRYVVLCLALATLETEQRQTTLRQVAERTELFVRSDAEFQSLDFGFDLKLLEHRRDLVAVMRLLQRWNVLVRADGDDTQFVHGGGDCLYRIDRPTLAGILGSVRGASTIDLFSLQDRITALNETELPESSDAQNRALQHSLVRRLLDDPVMYFDELTPREYEYWNGQAERLLNELHKITGLEIERRAEGVALLDLDGRWSDVGLPEAGTRGHATLLLAEWLANQLRDSTVVELVVPYEAVIDQFRELAQYHAQHWRKDADTAEGIRQIADEAIDVLHSLGLLDVTRTGVKPRPAVARFRLEEPIE
ncbi:MAG: TIGR02678 family protein [Planctomycetaceae bacterium]|nr:TIGR02678 family protein [Planctomycetaceae bacterium]